MKTKKGLALQDILAEIQVLVNKSEFKIQFSIFKYKYYHLMHVFFFFFTVEFPDDILIDLIIRMAEIEKRVISGCSEAVQLNSLVAAFQKPREIEIS